jgi:hypothetical protein
MVAPKYADICTFAYVLLRSEDWTVVNEGRAP